MGGLPSTRRSFHRSLWTGWCRSIPPSCSHHRILLPSDRSCARRNRKTICPFRQRERTIACIVRHTPTHRGSRAACTCADLVETLSLRIERLARQHRPLLDQFECQVPELVVYLRRWALVHQERDRLGRTWIAIDDGIEGSRVAGYFTLAAASLERGLVSVGDLSRLPGFPVPAILLARLAVDRRVQNQGLGTWLFDEALRRTLTLSADGPIGFRVLITDATDEGAAKFYERFGLVRLTEGRWPCRMVLDLKPLVPQ